MKFTETAIEGVWIIDIEAHTDDRGGFARTYCVEEFAAHGLPTAIEQCNMSFNHAVGTVRGFHLQMPPSAEAKLVRCTSGAVYDVALDLRPDSPTRYEHVGVELSAANRRMLFIPEMCAHGYQTLTDGAEVTYQLSASYAPDAERGYRYDDPAFGIDWPLPVSHISDKDASWDLV